MRIYPARIRSGICSSPASRLFPALVLAFVLLGATSAFAITRAEVLARAQNWIDRQIPYSQSRWYGGYRTDCSGFNSMAWQTRVNGHAYSYSTRSLHDVSTRISPDDLKPGDAMIKYNYHARVFYGWVDATHTSYIAYEQTGPTSKSSIKYLAYDLGYGYRAYRFDKITDGPPAWNAVVNPTFDVWASGAPVWWQVSGGWASAVCTRSVDVRKSSRNALGLLNPYSRPRDVVEISQTASVTAGLPYTLSMWACTDTVPSGLEMRLRFLDASGNTLATTATTGAAWSVEATRLAQMSLMATAPAQATSATVSVRLAGGVDATGTPGTRAVIDDFRLYDSSPVGSAISISATSVVRAHSLTLSGLVTGPMPIGTVRIYVKRPGKASEVTLDDRAPVAGAWSRRLTPGYRGTYTFTAKYMGYGPWGPVTSKSVSLRVR